MTTRISATVPDSHKEAIEEYARKMDTSEAEVVRCLIESGLQDGSTFDVEISEAYIENVEWEAMVAEHKPDQRRKYFPHNVKEKFHEDFQKGLGERGLNMTREEFLDEVSRFFDGEEAEEMREFVNRVADNAIEAAESSEFDPLDPETTFDDYEGVREGREREAAEDDLDAVIEAAKARIRNTSASDPEAVARSLAKEFGVAESIAEEAVETAVAELGEGNGGGRR